MQLRVCGGCRRHVGVRETTCPFCAHALPLAPAPRAVRLGRVSRAAVFSAALVACSKEPAKQAPPQAAHGSDGSDDLEKLLDHQPRVVEVPDAAAATEPVDAAIAAESADAAVGQAATPIDAGVPDAGAVVKKKRRQQQNEKKRLIEQVEKQHVIDHRHMAKPYGAPPARRRIV